MNKRGFLAGAAAAAMIAPAGARAEGPVFQVIASDRGAQGAAPLGFGLNIIAPTDGPGYSVTLPGASGSGGAVDVVTRSLQFVVIYPPAGASISYFGPGVGYAIYPGTYLTFRDTGVGQWDFLYNVASNFPVLIGIVAHAGGGQADATQLCYGSNVIATCAARGDSLRLPIALGAGEQCFITNHGAAACRIFPEPGGRINCLRPDVPYWLPRGKAALFVDIGPPNQWDGGILA